MAVNVSTIASVCLYCKANSANNEGKHFHEIYDEVGLELQLPDLVETFFHIKVKNEGRKHLCDDCVNRLIELYDLEEHAKEENGKASDLEISQGIKREIVRINGSDQIVDHLFENGIVHTSELPRNHQTNTNTDNLKQGDPEIIPQKDDIEYEGIENVEEAFVGKAQSAPIANDVQAVLIIENDDTSVISISEEAVISSEQDCNEHIEYIEDDGIQNFDLEIIDNGNIINSPEVINLKESEFKIRNGPMSEAEYEPNEDENSFMEINAYEEQLNETLLANDNSNLQDEEDQEHDFEEIFIEKIDDISFDELSSADEKKECVTKTNSKATNSKSNSMSSNGENQKVDNTGSITFTTYETQKESNIEFTDTEQIIDNDQDEYSNDTFSLEEEYLIEEISCSDDYDNVDLNEYLDKILITKFQDLQLIWETECKLCQDNYNTLEELLNHSCIKIFEEEQQFCCTIKDCDDNMENVSSFARHLILKHCDKLESIAIYGKCPDCQKSFSNISDFNKHSCCRNIRRKPGSPNYCQCCDMDFQSLKRYVFHMQFHLTNRRPKLCLLCGDIFNNSNDFFEHTQYEHTPKAAMACIKCDRFFNEKHVFDSHMETHKDLKLRYACTLCSKKYLYKVNFLQHTDICHNNKSNPFQCEHCDKTFVNKLSYRNHIKSHASDVQLKSFVCSNCGLIANDLECIKTHIKSDKHSDCFSSIIEEKSLCFAYNCENCSLDFFTIRQLKEHRLSKSHSDDLYHCVICKQVFNNLRHMRIHCKNHKNYYEWESSFPIKRFFVCNIGDCQEFSPIWNTLYYHKKRPHKIDYNLSSSNEFKCQFCQQMCSSKMSLAVHVARSHNNFNVKCPHCKRSCKSEELLQEHIKKYHTPVECDICYKKFKHSRNLESHNNMVHLNLKRYFCKFCGKGYFYGSERNSHEKKVHPDKAYKCEICKFTTTYPESLKIHMDKHNNVLKFKCTMCPKKFGRKQLLDIHLKRHLNKKDYSCEKYLKEGGCTASFFSHNLLKRHIRAKHTILNSKEDKNTSDQPLDTLEIEDISIEMLDSDADTKSEQDSQLHDEDFEQDAMEMVLEDENNLIGEQ